MEDDSNQLKAILLGGQSGAGKTTIHRIKKKEFQGNIIFIDDDSYCSQHPDYLALQGKYGKDSEDYTKGVKGKWSNMWLMNSARKAIIC